MFLPTTFPMMFPITFILGLLNVLLLKVRTSAILRPSELMLVYIMLTSATAAAGHDTLEILTQIVAYPVHFASPENDWKSIFFHYLPTRLVILDPLFLHLITTENYHHHHVMHHRLHRKLPHRLLPNWRFRLK